MKLQFEWNEEISFNAVNVKSDLIDLISNQLGYLLKSANFASFCRAK